MPIFWAYSNKQLEEELNKRGLTLDDTDKICCIANGGFCLKTDKEKIKAYFNREDELPKLMKDYDFAFDAIYYEMANHEYHINWQADWDVCSCFGKVKYTDEEDELERYFKELGWDEVTRKAYMDARKKFYSDADEKGWY